MPSPLPGAVSRTKYHQTLLTGADVRLMRKHRGWSLRHLSGLTGVDRAHLSRIENGKATISDHLALRLFRLLTTGEAATERR